MKPSLSKDGKPVLDEATLQKLLEAAYVVQEHTNRASEGTPPDVQAQSTTADSDSTTTLAEIVETQHQIHTGRHDLSIVRREPRRGG